MSEHVYTFGQATGDDIVPKLKQHSGNGCSTSHSPEHNAESHVISQLGMIRQAYNPSNIFYAEELCSLEQIVSYL